MLQNNVCFKNLNVQRKENILTANSVHFLVLHKRTLLSVRKYLVFSKFT